MNHATVPIVTPDIVSVWNYGTRYIKIFMATESTIAVVMVTATAVMLATLLARFIMLGASTVFPTVYLEHWGVNVLNFSIFILNSGFVGLSPELFPFVGAWLSSFLSFLLSFRGCEESNFPLSKKMSTE